MEFVLVARAKKTTTDQLKLTKDTIERGGGTVLGVVLNQVPVSGLGRLRYGETEYAYTSVAYQVDNKDRNERRRRRSKSTKQDPEMVPYQAEQVTPKPGASTVGKGSSTADFVNMLENDAIKEGTTWSGRG
ncbi:Capsular polysaccharide biosynthesis protein [Actinomyces bovis]|uniref:Capsular polysaccharide biosynthesis protein n=1 Tax=Actinomyces bovis TaxID=1658 RepID=A0ABY1VLW5_9ACTO|nr:Capsular polysaccharide biosynthesis protein [Actinomyces bovis]